MEIIKTFVLVLISINFLIFNFQMEKKDIDCKIQFLSEISTNPSSWSREYVNEAYNLGLLSDDLNYNFQSPIRREDFISLKINLIKIVDNNKSYLEIENTFIDITNYGIIKSLECEKAQPNIFITREEAMWVLSEAIDYLGFDFYESQNKGQLPTT